MLAYLAFFRRRRIKEVVALAGTVRRIGDAEVQWRRTSSSGRRTHDEIEVGAVDIDSRWNYIVVLAVPADRFGGLQATLRDIT
jgi:hypothetical protein